MSVCVKKGCLCLIDGKTAFCRIPNMPQLKTEQLRNFIYGEYDCGFLYSYLKIENFFVRE